MAPPDILSLLARNHAEKLAVVDDRPGEPVRALTFSEFNAEVNRLANLLCERRVLRGDKIVWCGQNSIGVIRAIHAARKAGATAVPLNYRLSAEEAAYVVDHCDAVLVYTDAEYADLMHEIRRDIPKVRDVIVFAAPRC